MAKRTPKCKCEVAGYTVQRLRGRTGQFSKSIVTPLMRTTDCKLHRSPFHE